MLEGLLSSAEMYLASQTLLGAKQARIWCLREIVKPQPGLCVLDVGCGPGFAAAELPDATYFGYDISERYIDYANRHYGAYGTFRCQLLDDAEVDKLPSFDLILLHGLLHHLTDEEARGLLKLCRRALKPGGYVSTLDGCYTPNQNWLDHWLLSHDRGQYVRDAAGYEALSREVFPEVDATIRSDLMHVPYTLIFQKLGGGAPANG